MNQIFNPSRFYKYAKCDVLIHKNQYGYTLAGFTLILLIIEILVLINNRNLDAAKWTFLFLATLAIGGILIASHCFSSFRKKESTLQYIVTPASVFEKFIYEFLSKILLFVVLLWIMFPLISDIAVFIAELIKPQYNPMRFNYSCITTNRYKPHNIALFISLYIFVFSVFFAGSSAIKKYPLIKTLLFMGTIFFIVLGYMYFLSETLDLNNGIEYFAKILFKNRDESKDTLIYLLCLTSISSWIYSYFKIKEREV